MNTMLKLSLMTLVIGTTLSASLFGHHLYQCPGEPDVFYKTLAKAEKVCPDEAYKVSYHQQHARYYRVDDDGNYYYEDGRGVVGDAVEGAHDVASNVWHNVLGL